ncbi:MAG: hypothetical protein E2O36_07085 [Proteobacteria bacterium]|nr:MAG: hypothetical protein E2O36_07085 [Pseudomonadota bacterium]TDJ68358.1 MAG: hypothetical protein E2O35_02895 [Pseudomonadota bacterium]
MSEVELVWIRECEVCAIEHRYMETHKIESIDDVESESGAFKLRCENWYRTHIESLLAQQLS